ncbi:hypothetical protein [Streptomyces sp. NPDC057509]
MDRVGLAAALFDEGEPEQQAATADDIRARAKEFAAARPTTIAA